MEIISVLQRSSWDSATTQSDERYGRKGDSTNDELHWTSHKKDSNYQQLVAVVEEYRKKNPFSAKKDLAEFK